MAQARPLTVQEIELLLAPRASRTDIRDRAWMTLGIYAGYRISELLSLRLRDVVEYGAVRAEVTVERRNMKGRQRSRTMLLHPRAQAAIQCLVDEMAERGYVRPECYLFQSTRHRGRKTSAGSPLGRRQAARIMNERKAELQLPGKISTHSLRKTFARRMLSALNSHPDREVRERSMFCLQELMGHAKLDSTVHYVSWSREKLHALVLTA